jgi:AcrR family transcriptional regulator
MRQKYHKATTVESQYDPRGNQKARTRGALVEAARALLRAGTPPTVPEAADAAKVSRATAYRYFPTQEALLVELADIGPASAPVEEMLAGLKSEEVDERVLGLVDTFNSVVVAEEAPMRNALRIYLDTWLQNQRGGAAAPPVREGRRMRWLEEALVPARRQLAPEQFRRLQAVLALTTGIEALVVMKDVCRLDDERALATLRWAAAALLEASLAGTGSRRGEARPGRRAR